MYNLAPLRFQSVSFTTTSLGANDPQVGDRVIVGNEAYVFVYNVGNSAIAPSNVCVVSAVSGYSVTISSTTSVDLAVGVCKHSTIATGGYGYLVTRGFCQVQMAADHSAAAGGIFCLAADGKVAGKSISTGYPEPVVGKLMQACATAASGTAYISLW